MKQEKMEFVGNSAPSNHSQPLKTVAIMMLGAMLVSCAGWMPGRQAYWDAKVKEMCEKDGGVTVYERVEITGDEYKQFGGAEGTIPVPDERLSKRDIPYFSKLSVKEINTEYPRVTRRETEIVRRADGKVLGKVVIYARVGGDFPTGITHATYFSCQDVPGIRLDVEKQIFAITANGETK